MQCFQEKERVADVLRADDYQREIRNLTHLTWKNAEESQSRPILKVSETWLSTVCMREC